MKNREIISRRNETDALEDPALDGKVWQLAVEELLFHHVPYISPIYLFVSLNSFNLSKTN